MSLLAPTVPLGTRAPARRRYHIFRGVLVVFLDRGGLGPRIRVIVDVFRNSGLIHVVCGGIVPPFSPLGAILQRIGRCFGR